MPLFDLSPGSRNTHSPAVSEEGEPEDAVMYYTQASHFAGSWQIARCCICGLRGEMPGGRWIHGNVMCEPCAVDRGATIQCEPQEWERCLAVRRPGHWLPESPAQAGRVDMSLYVPVRASRREGHGFRKAEPLPLP
jgi:hypothetical protein